MLIPNKLLLRIVALLLSVGTGLLFGCYLLFLYLPTGAAGTTHDLSISSGTTFTTVSKELQQAGVIRSSLHLRLAARLRGVDRRMQAGDYRISADMTPSHILAKLAAGETDGRIFTLPEGYSIYQVAALLEEQALFSRTSFLAACVDRDLLARLEIPGSSVEGYLFPGTYKVGFSMNVQGLISEMVATFRRRTAGMQDRGLARGMTLEQVVILASMVEREAVAPAEKPLIASVFLNRLRIGMPLQSDPTAIYGFKIFGGTVTRQDLQRRSSYNTYLLRGLPSGPIGNPGLEALKAVLQPAQTKYLYFVARKDGTHQFSETLQEHNRAVQQYLK